MKMVTSLSTRYYYNYHARGSTSHDLMWNQM